MEQALHAYRRAMYALGIAERSNADRSVIDQLETHAAHLYAVYASF